VARYRVAPAARADIADVLRYRNSRFGSAARQRYLALIGTTFEAIANQPERIGSHARNELAPGLRSFHLRHCRTQIAYAGINRPRHIVFYRVGADRVIDIVRLLHESMEGSRHLQD